MPGAFDFYVDEDLLKQLFGDDDKPESRPAAAADSHRNGAGATAVAAPPPQRDGALQHDGEDDAAVELLHSSAAESVTSAEPVIPVAAPVVAETPEAAAQAAAVAGWQDADRLYAAGEFAQAAELYRSACAENGPHTSTLQYNAGIAWLEAGQPGPAGQAFRDALVSDPEFRLARLALGSALLEVQDPAGALECFDGISDSDLEALQGRVRACFALGRLEDAENAAAALVQASPGDDALMTALLTIQVVRQDEQASELAAKELAERDPESTAAIETLIALAIKREDHTAAAQHCDSLLALGGLDAKELVRSAAIYQNAGQYEKAADAAQRALVLSPDAVEASLILADCRDLLGETEAAREVLEELLRNEFAPPETRLKLASLQAAEQRYEEAVSTLEACLQARKEWPEALFQLGTVLHQMGQGEEAQETMLKALRLKPGEVPWIERVEAVALERNDPIVALDCHERLVALQAGTPEMSYNVGVMLQLESEPELAAKCFIRALEQKPDFGEALLNLGHALHELGRGEEAIVCWSKAVLLNPVLANGYFD